MSAHVETPSYVWPTLQLATVDLAPWDRPFLTWKGPNYEPKEAFSPSGLQTWGECQRKGYFRYVLGIREFEFTWAQMAGRPSPVHSNKRTQARLTKIYNKRRGPALGKATHGVLEQHFGYHIAGPHSVNSSVENWRAQWAPGLEPKPVSAETWKSLPGRLALSGLGLLPDPEQCAWLDIEGQIQLTSAVVLPKMEPILFNGFRDLLAAFRNDRLRLYDYKTTGDVQWIKSPEELALGEQPAIYGLDVLAWQSHYPHPLECSWVYFLTKGNPYAERVDFEMTRRTAESRVRALALQADSIRTKMRKGASEDEYPCNTEHCPHFGGCAMHKDRGGPCEAKADFLSRYVQITKPNHPTRKRLETATERVNTMGNFRTQRAAARGAAVPEGDGVNAPEGDQDGPADQGTPEPVAAAPAPRRGRPPAAAGAAPRAPRAAAPAAAATASDDDTSITVTFGGKGGPMLTIPPSTPLYDRLSKLYQANYG